MKNINSLNSAVSIIAVNFTGKCLKWYFLILVTILEKNLILLHRHWGIFKLLTNLSILQTIHVLALTSLLHLHPSIIVDSGSEKSLCSSYHHDHTEKLTLEFLFLYYIWDFKNAEIGSTQLTIKNLAICICK